MTDPDKVERAPNRNERVPPMPDPMVGVRAFTDGATREVYPGPDGRQ
jgi:hypothetical protein